MCVNDHNPLNLFTGDQRLSEFQSRLSNTCRGGYCCYVLNTNVHLKLLPTVHKCMQEVYEEGTEEWKQNQECAWMKSGRK